MRSDRLPSEVWGAARSEERWAPEDPAGAQGPHPALAPTQPCPGPKPGAGQEACRHTQEPCAVLLEGGGWPSVRGSGDRGMVSGRERDLWGGSGLGLRPPGFLSLILLALRFWNHTW